jgi:hypothetical protein
MKFYVEMLQEWCEIDKVDTPKNEFIWYDKNIKIEKNYAYYK